MANKTLFSSTKSKLPRTDTWNEAGGPAYTFAPKHALAQMAANHAFQVKSVLSKLLLCRTKTLGGHTYVCRPCGTSCEVYNSCGDRHCPLCAGARRADWMDKTRELILPGIHYFQVVFTLPDRFSRLILGKPMTLVESTSRPSWREVFQGSATHSPLVNFPWLRSSPRTRQSPYEPDG
ncbi:MAG: transposase zinc-binding domain-containing protein [Planctomycetaceae bacterium]|nr:transposase zinc-binding domain-containing protein [Planctomycetaceae bacterium]